MSEHMPRLILAGLSGGSGKTLLTLGLCRHFAQNGLVVKPFKKGPDYIDAAWMALAARRSASNLDPFLMDTALLRSLFADASQGADMAIIEGNRGLFDGKDVQGTCSTAELAKTLRAPVVLVVDCTKMTRTTAAIVQGCVGFDPELHIAGVVLNRTAGQRHRRIARQSVEYYTDVPVLGTLPKLRHNPIPERHMGLVSDQECAAEAPLEELGQLMADWIDIPRIQSVGYAASTLPAEPGVLWPEPVTTEPVRIGVVRDAALWFYYQENIEALRRAGAEIAQISLLDDAPWPELHGLYLGGGFPETLAPRLSAQKQVRERVAALARSGLPIYAECGGLMYLCQELTYQETTYPMAGLFPVRAEMGKKPQGHGYTQARVLVSNPYHPQGAQIPGHEFHYSQCHTLHGETPPFAFFMERGCGIQEGFDGFLSRNTLACYTHLHALSSPHWAPNFVAASLAYKHSHTPSA